MAGASCRRCCIFLPTTHCEGVRVSLGSLKEKGLAVWELGRGEREGEKCKERAEVEEEDREGGREGKERGKEKEKKLRRF